MKLRVGIIITFILCVGLLFCLWRIIWNSPEKPTEPVWNSTVSDLRECSRIKHIESAEYDDFATVADSEQHHQAARLFRALAQSGRIHEDNCANAIHKFGGSYTPPTKVIMFRGSTPNNLLRSVEMERRMLQKYSTKYIDRALRNGNRYAARILIWIAGSDLKHIDLLERYTADSVALFNSNESYTVCPTCGNVYRLSLCNSYCPFCHTSEKDFIKFL